MIDKSVWTHGGFVKDHLLASEVARTNPAYLTDEQIATLDAYDGGRDLWRQKRHLALLKQYPPIAPATVASSPAKATSAKAPGETLMWKMREGESWDTFSKRIPGITPVPFAMFKSLYTHMRERLKALKTANDALLAHVKWFEVTFRNEMAKSALTREQQEQPQKSAEARVETVVDTLDMGVWEKGKTYPAGALVTSSGHIYCAQRETQHEPISGTGDWRLAARRGKQGKDGKDGRPASAESIDARLRFYGLIP